jgi:glycosyltransferase involved in cell wall biosynthesis
MAPISVIIPTYNHARFLVAAIDSALSQTLKPSEVIVVDDGSTDATSALLQAFRGKIRILRQKNLGVAVARNRGAEMATGDYLAFLDADDVWLPRKLEMQLNRFQSEPGLGLVHCGLEQIDEDNHTLGQTLDGMEGLVANEMLLFIRSTILGGGSGAMMPRAVFQEAGKFDERLSTSADWDLYYRIARKHKIGFVPTVLLQYRLHGTNMHASVRAMEHDMLLAYSKAFLSADDVDLRLQRRCLGNLHKVLAGSFFSTGERLGFLRNALKSVILTPENITYFAQYPVRRWLRKSLTSAARAS